MIQTRPSPGGTSIRLFVQKVVKVALLFLTRPGTPAGAVMDAKNPRFFAVYIIIIGIEGVRKNYYYRKNFFLPSEANLVS